MKLGKRIDFVDGSYEVRGFVDGRYIVRIRKRTTNTENYLVWTERELVSFDKKERNRVDQMERNAQIYERRLAGETFSALAEEFNISPSRVSGIYARQARKERHRSPTKMAS